MQAETIEAFLAVVRDGQFTRAARRLGLSQPALSRRIESLEDDLGAMLFERGPRGARLTSAGSALLPHAERLVATIADGRRAIADHSGAVSGQVVIALVGTLASTTLPVRLRVFRDRYPGATLRLRTARSDEVSELVRQGVADVGLRYFPDPSAGLVSRVIGDEPLVVVAAPDVEIDVTRLDGWAWVTYPVGSGASGEPFAVLLQRALIRAGIEPGETIAIDSLTAQKRLVEAGFGLALLPLSAITEERRIGSLVALDVPALTISVPIVMLTRRDGYLGQADPAIAGDAGGRGRLTWHEGRRRSRRRPSSLNRIQPTVFTAAGGSCC